MAAPHPDPHEPIAIGDYALISDCTTAALVGNNGSIDWLCWPRFDSGACFAALLGNSDCGRWSIRPAADVVRVNRTYRGDSLILETVFETASGAFALIDFMPAGPESSSVIRIVEGRKGNVPVRMNLKLRFDYGSSVPWVTRLPENAGIVAIAGPNLAVLRSPVPMHGEDLSTACEFMVTEGQRVSFAMSYGASHRPPPTAIDTDTALSDTEEYWKKWSSRCTYDGAHRDAVMRSLLTLKALTFAETGGIVAAPTTSLPEHIGGARNWDYRYCWIRDATLTLAALMGGGYYDEARAWRDWLHRSLAGTPDDLQIMYGIAGERRLAEWEVEWLPGYRGSAPVRIGNAASSQLQLDVWGEMMNALHLAREGGLAPEPAGWALQTKALEKLEQIWNEPDEGLWESRAGPRHYTHSKVMAWVAFDRSVRDAEKYNLEAPVARWRAICDEIHRTVCDKGFNRARNSFTQVIGGDDVDASLLMIPQVGFLPCDDPRVTGTVKQIERELVVDGFVLRYRTERVKDGLPPGEGVFLACSFWLADVYQRQGRVEEANAMVERLLSLRNDVGLLSEEYDPAARQHLGNFPQAFSHLALVQTVLSLNARVPLRDELRS